MTARMSFMVPVDVHAEDALPDGIRHVADRGHVVHDPGDVREAVDRVAGGLDDAGDARVVGDVGGERHDVGAGVLGDELVEALLADVDGDDASAFAGDAGCRGAADARTRAGHDDGLAR